MAEGRQATDDALLWLLESETYSDLTIKCGDKEFKVHKSVVCARSEFFATACEPGAFKEGHDDIVNLHAATKPGDETDPSLDDPEAVGLMIDFLYIHDYDAPWVSISISEDNLGNESRKFCRVGDMDAVMHAKVYALGSKYSLPSLQAVALRKYKKAASSAWATDIFVKAIGLVYTNTPDEDKGLRDITASIIMEHHSVLLKRPQVERQVRSISGLSYDLLGLESDAVLKLEAELHQVKQEMEPKLEELEKLKRQKAALTDGVVSCFECGEAFKANKYCNEHGSFIGCDCDDAKRSSRRSGYGNECTCRRGRNT